MNHFKFKYSRTKSKRSGKQKSQRAVPYPDVARLCQHR